MQYSRYAAIVLMCLMMFGGLPASAAGMRIDALQVEPVAGGENIVLMSRGVLQPKQWMLLQNPDRIAIDFQRLESSSLSLASGYKGVVRGIRMGQFDASTTRVVLDLHHAVMQPTPRTEARAGGGTRYIIPLRYAANAAKPALAPAPAATPTPVASVDEKPLIVIDAGHGGKDPGAIGARGTREKVITLDVARLLKQSLLRTGRYRVAMTRDDDRFIMLHERVEIARRQKADLFLSIHADSNPRATARGLSIYTISETASDAEAEALATRENAVDDLSGMDLGQVDKDVADILLDLATRETKEKSSQLADIMLEAMPARVQKLTQAHRYAGFRVLKAPDIPSVLIELGFLSNTQDEKLLLTKEYRDLLASGITRGIDAYFVMVKRR